MFVLHSGSRRICHRLITGNVRYLVIFVIAGPHLFSAAQADSGQPVFSMNARIISARCEKRKNTQTGEAQSFPKEALKWSATTASMASAKRLKRAT